MRSWSQRSCRTWVAQQHKKCRCRATKVHARKIHQPLTKKDTPSASADAKKNNVNLDNSLTSRLYSGHQISMLLQSVPSMAPKDAQEPPHRLWCHRHRSPRGKGRSSLLDSNSTRQPDRAHARTHGRNETKRFPNWTRPPTFDFQVDVEASRVLFPFLTGSCASVPC